MYHANIISSITDNILGIILSTTEKHSTDINDEVNQNGILTGKPQKILKNPVLIKLN